MSFSGTFLHDTSKLSATLKIYFSDMIKIIIITYINKYHLFQGIATYDLSFIQVHAGWPGRANDSRFWTNTDTFDNLDNYLADRSRSLIDSYHIVVDSAFPCRKHLMTPYKSPFGEDLDVVRSNFNRCLSSKRQVRQDFNI